MKSEGGGNLKEGSLHRLIGKANAGERKKGGEMEARKRKLKQHLAGEGGTWQTRVLL